MAHIRFEVLSVSEVKFVSDFLRYNPFRRFLSLGPLPDFFHSRGSNIAQVCGIAVMTFLYPSKWRHGSRRLVVFSLLDP